MVSLLLFLIILIILLALGPWILQQIIGLVAIMIGVIVTMICAPIIILDNAIKRMKAKL
jgi:hypothetical protein